MDPLILKKAKDWAHNPVFSSEERSEIQTLLDKLPATEGELTDRFYRGLEFGTGGMRGVLGVGENRINRHTIRRASQAVAQTLLAHFPQGASVVVSYDSRHCSREFAEETCAVMAAHGIKSHIFPALTPTPMLSFAIRHLKAKGGVMVTASHNPPKYNGYKVYWDDGAQVVPPVDGEIVKRYGELDDWSKIVSKTFQEARTENWVQDVPVAVDEAFYQVILDKVTLAPQMCREHGHELGVIYTPLHGTGRVPCEEITRRLGFTRFETLAAQGLPDGNFPTVKYPNPEDPAALKLAVNRMLELKADLVLATDPDCDRLGLAVNHQGTPAYLNGNQIGALFLDYILNTRQKLGKMPAKPLVVKSIVTSPIQEAIASHFGVEVKATLTGFKWMAGLLRQLEEQHCGRGFVFASEESFGYMPQDQARDKDGVSSVALMCELALHHKRQGHDLVQALNLIYERYGFHHEELVSFEYEGIEGGKKILRIMESFRKNAQQGLAGYPVTRVDDYQQGVDGLPKSNVLALHFASNDKVFLRPSGTEPKIKFYLMVAVTEGSLEEKRKTAHARSNAYAEAIRKWCGEA